eukprot:gene39824-53855_t
MKALLAMGGEGPIVMLNLLNLLNLRKEAVFRDLAVTQIRPLPGLMALLDMADRAGVPMAAVTNAPRLNAEMMLTGLGIADRFAVLVIGDELAQGKPHPLPYLEGLRGLGGDPKASVAFEDSRSGVQAASAAGIATVGIRTSVGLDDLLAAGAATTAQSFDAPELVGWLAERMQCVCKGLPAATIDGFATVALNSCTCIMLRDARQVPGCFAAIIRGFPMATYNVAVIVGSLRKQSFSLRIAQAFSKLAPASLKLNIVTLEGLSFFNQDLEAAPPAHTGEKSDEQRQVQRLRR